MRNTADFSKADQVIRQALSDEAFTSANLLVGKGDRVLFRRAYGRLSMEDDAPLTTEHTRYDLASITKPLVVGMLTLRAWRQASCACGISWALFWMLRKTNRASPSGRS